MKIDSQTLRSILGILSGIDQPAYQVIDRLGVAVEVRRYGPCLVAETAATAPDLKQAQRLAFQRLSEYVSGANQRRAPAGSRNPVAEPGDPEQIPMMIPVEHSMAGKGGLTMRFFLPATYTVQTAPSPTNERVEIVPIPEATIAAVRFSGNRNADTLAFRATDLMGALEVSMWKAIGAPAARFYDLGWTLPSQRRHEIVVPVVRR